MAVPILRRLLGRSDDLALIAEDLVGSITLIAATAQDSSSAAAKATTASGQFSEGIASVAGATGQMSAVMREIAQSAAEATQVTSNATHVTERMRERVARLVGSASRIDSVVGTVTAISDQTRLLALNATIEAARAGAAGKGFAVVAEEVKQLAGETGSATTQITGQLGELAGDSDAVREAVDQIAEVLARVDALQQSIAAAVEQQSTVIAEITRVASTTAEAAEGLDDALSAASHAARSADGAVSRARSWLNRLTSVSVEQRQDILGLSDAVEVHPVRAALAAHTVWKQRLRTAIAERKLPPGTQMDQVARDDVCAFGVWLRGDASHEPSQRHLRSAGDLHAQFHRGAADVLRAVLSGENDRANALMSDQNSYGGAAERLTDLLLEWVQEVESDDLPS
jgi:ABC-type transporter Mla subunit MlaD